MKAAISNQRIFLLVKACSVLLFLSACATARDATWKTLPETNIPYERAWTIVVNTVSEYFTDLETIDGQSGYLRSGWKTVDTSWWGLSYGGKVPTARARIIVRVEERSPFKVKIRVERQERSQFRDWYEAGNDEKMEREIMDTLMGRLRKL